MDERTSAQVVFNETAEVYDRLRPRYPAGLFEALSHLAQLQPAVRVLEIGCGTGIATRPLAELGCAIIALEPGNELASVARRNLASFSNVEILETSFESWGISAGLFDVVVAATSFHWLDPSTRCGKIALGLRLGGHLVIVNYRHPYGIEDKFFERVQACYTRHMPGARANLLFHSFPGPCTDNPHFKELSSCRLFDEIAVRTFISERTYSRNDYLGLLATYPDHRLLPIPNQLQLFNCIGSIIDREFGGKVSKSFLFELLVARKREPTSSEIV